MVVSLDPHRNCVYRSFRLVHLTLTKRFSSLDLLRQLKLDCRTFSYVSKDFKREQFYQKKERKKEKGLSIPQSGPALL